MHIELKHYAEGALTMPQRLSGCTHPKGTHYVTEVIRADAGLDLLLPPIMNNPRDVSLSRIGCNDNTICVCSGVTYCLSDLAGTMEPGILRSSIHSHD